MVVGVEVEVVEVLGLVRDCDVRRYLGMIGSEQGLSRSKDGVMKNRNRQDLTDGKGACFYIVLQ